MASTTLVMPFILEPKTYTIRLSAFDFLVFRRFKGGFCRLIIAFRLDMEYGSFILSIQQYGSSLIKTHQFEFFECPRTVTHQYRH